MPVLILLAVLGLEGFVVYLVGDAMDSLGLAIWIAIGTCFLGASLLGKAKANLDPERLQHQMLMGGNPGKAIQGVIAPFIGAVLLLFPGFITDFVGLLVLFPPTRVLFAATIKKLVMRALQKPMQQQMQQQMGGVDPAQMQKMMEQMFQGGQMPGGSTPGPGQGPRGGDEKVKDADFRVID